MRNNFKKKLDNLPNINLELINEFLTWIDFLALQRTSKRLNTKIKQNYLQFEEEYKITFSLKVNAVLNKKFIPRSINTYHFMEAVLANNVPETLKTCSNLHQATLTKKDRLQNSGKLSSLIVFFLILFYLTFTGITNYREGKKLNDLVLLVSSSFLLLFPTFNFLFGKLNKLIEADNLKFSQDCNSAIKFFPRLKYIRSQMEEEKEKYARIEERDRSFKLT